MSAYREAHVCATAYLSVPHLYKTLARRIFDRNWFPRCFRPAFHAERQRDLAAGRLTARTRRLVPLPALP